MEMKVRGGEVKCISWFNDWGARFEFKYSWHFNYWAH